MNARKRHWPARETPQHAPSNAAAGLDDELLVEVLAAASGPATDDELAGEGAAVAAFSQARLGAVTGRGHRLRTRLAKLAASKTTVVTLIGAAAAGGAWAAGGGVPGLFNEPPVVVPPPISPAATSPPTAPQSEADSSIEPTAPPGRLPAASPPGEAPSGEPAPNAPTSSPGDPGPLEPTLPVEVPRVPILPTDGPVLDPDLPVIPSPTVPGVEPLNVPGSR